VRIPSARTDLLFKANLIANGLTRLFSELPGDAPGRHASGDTPRLKDEHIPLEKAEQRRRNARGLARSRGSLEDKVGSALQRGKNLRQNRIDWKCRGSIHSLDRNMVPSGPSIATDPLNISGMRRRSHPGDLTIQP
jgi:hypothetical protein